MASNYTTNYELPIWAADDAFLRTEFNDTNQKVEDALTEIAAGVPKIIHGSYTGNGMTSQVISLPLGAPQALIVSLNGQLGTTNITYGGVVFPGGGNNAITIGTDGFTATGSGTGSGTRPAANMNGTVYHYIAFYWSET